MFCDHSSINVLPCDLVYREVLCLYLTCLMSMGEILHVISLQHNSSPYSDLLYGEILCQVNLFDGHEYGYNPVILVFSITALRSDLLYLSLIHI